MIYTRPMDDLTVFRLWVLAFPVGIGLVVVWFMTPWWIAKRRGISFVPLYYLAALTLGTPVLGWLLALIYATTSTPDAESGQQPRQAIQ